MTINPTEALKLAGQMAARYRFLTREDQEDVAVDAVLRMLKNHDGVRSWKGYLGSCVFSLAMDRRRGFRHQAIIVVDSDEMEGYVSNRNDYSEVDARLSIASQIPEGSQELASHLASGCDMQDAAEAMGIKYGAVRLRVHRMRNEMGGQPAWLN